LLVLYHFHVHHRNCLLLEERAYWSACVCLVCLSKRSHVTPHPYLYVSFLHSKSSVA
jgi:hypothetical protein